MLFRSSQYNEPIDYDINNVFEETYVLQIDGNNIKMSDNLFCIMFYLLENYNEFKKHSYCRIALRGLPEDNGFFEMQKKNISSNKLYHFILNSNYKETTDIRDIYAVIKINNIGYKINFVKF